MIRGCRHVCSMPCRPRRRSPPTSACASGSRPVGRDPSRVRRGRAAGAADAVRTCSRAASVHNAYGSVAGSMGARAAAAGYYSAAGPDDARADRARAGLKPLLWALISMLDGDVILPRPSWVSYAAQAHLAGAGCGPSRSQRPRRRAGAGRAVHTLEWACGRRRPGVLVVTLPDNPTGTLAPRRCRPRGRRDRPAPRARDRLRRDLPRPRFRPRGFLSPASSLPERTFVTNGLRRAWRSAAGGSASHGCPTVRSAAAGPRSPAWRARCGRASRRRCRPSPTTCCRAGRGGRARRRGRRLHAAVDARRVEAVTGAGAACRPPAAASTCIRTSSRCASARGVEAPTRSPSGCWSATTSACSQARRSATTRRAALPDGDEPAVRRRRRAAPADARQRGPGPLPWIAEPLQRLGAAVAAAG